MTGNLCAVTNANSHTTVYGYDGLSRLASVTQPGGEIESCAYDDHGVAVDTRGSVTAASLPGAQLFTFSYHANDLVKDILRSNGTVTHYSYEPTGELKTASVSRASGAIEEFAYYYTPSGQMMARTDHEGAHSYGYTPTYRLAQVQNPAGSLLSNEEFSYDAVGNRTDMSGVSYNVNNQTVGTGITFDANGNLTAKGGATFTWDLKNRLRTFSNGTDTEVSYVYDPFGRRIKKTVTISGVATTTYFLWDGDQMIAEYNGSGNLTKRYAYLGGYAPVQMAEVSGTSETIYDVHTDHLDTPKFLTNQAGTVVWRATHKAYGEAIVNEDTDGNGTNITFNLRFPGQYFDKESNLHYNRFRYYDTNMGRYLTADPIGQAGGLNVYTYASNSPVNMIDLLGLLGRIQPHPTSDDIHFAEPNAFDKWNGMVVCQNGQPTPYVPEDRLDDPRNERCGIFECMREHEESHIEDLKRRDPRPCRGAPDGWAVEYSGPFGESRGMRSERRAYDTEIRCLEKAKKEHCDPECQEWLDQQLENAREQRGWYE